MRERDDCDSNVPIVTVEDVLTASECDELIAQINRGAWHPTAKINRDTPLITSGPDASDAGRDQDGLACLEDPRLALRLYHRVAEHLPEAVDERELFGLKPIMHCLRYASGHSSSLHRDHAYHGERDERSELTLLIYLNDGFEGGQTEFPDHGRLVSARPGRAVLFRHGTMHRGRTVGAGTKYVLRTEVYYGAGSGRAG